MWAILPVKRLEHSKLRLAGILMPAQRRQLILYMLEDILDALDSASVISGITVVTCDTDIIQTARGQGAGVLDTGVDAGYAEDVLKGVEHISDKGVDKALVIPADVPELDHTDLTSLDQVHTEGITLCPAENDGGTNSLIFTPPLAISLMYGENSFAGFRKEAGKRQVPVRAARPPGLARDIDRPDDLVALRSQPTGNRTWRYLRSLELPI